MSGNRVKKFSTIPKLSVNLFVNRAMATLMPIMMFIMNFATVLVVWVGSQQLDLGNIVVKSLNIKIKEVNALILNTLTSISSDLNHLETNFQLRFDD